MSMVTFDAMKFWSDVARITEVADNKNSTIAELDEALDDMEHIFPDEYYNTVNVRTNMLCSFVDHSNATSELVRKAILMFKDMGIASSFYAHCERNSPFREEVYFTAYDGNVRAQETLMRTWDEGWESPNGNLFFSWLNENYDIGFDITAIPFEMAVSLIGFTLPDYGLVE
jgi:hypothetical protein